MDWKASLCLIDQTDTLLSRYEELYLQNGFDVVGTTHTSLFWQLVEEEKLHLLICITKEETFPQTLEMIRQIRLSGYDVGIVVLLEEERENYVLEAFEAGVDECVSLHVNMREILWRTKAVLRRVTQNFDYLSHDEIFMIPAKRELRINHVPVHVSQLHYQLLSEFVRFQDMYLSRRYLAEHVWGKPDMDDKPINTAVCRLNKDLYTHLSRQLILCKRDFGYYLSSQPGRMDSRQFKCKW